jgi:hypothetical protein
MSQGSLPGKVNERAWVADAERRRFQSAALLYDGGEREDSRGYQRQSSRHVEDDLLWPAPGGTSSISADESLGRQAFTFAPWLRHPLWVMTLAGSGADHRALGPRSTTGGRMSSDRATLREEGTP